MGEAEGFWDSFASGRAQEREETVAFLRRLSSSAPSIDARKSLSDAADAIEREEHRQ